MVAATTEFETQNRRQITEKFTVPIRILIVIEKSFKFSRSHFGLSNLLETFLYPREWWVRFELSLAHRRKGGNNDLWAFLDIPPPPNGGEGESELLQLLRGYQQTVERFLGTIRSEERNQNGNCKITHQEVFSEFKKMVATVLNFYRLSNRGNFDLPTSRADLITRYQRVLLEGVQKGWQFQDGFQFRNQALEDFDEIWLFGIDQKPRSRISRQGLLKLKERMNGGCGIFACGDHGRLGSSLCGELPRVRLMQRWHDDKPPPDLGDVTQFEIPMNSLVGGRDNPATLGIDESKVLEDTDQSDDVPTPLDITPYRNYHIGLDGKNIPEGFNTNPYFHPHPVFSCGTQISSNGRIDRFPDHMHEGEIVMPGFCSKNPCDSPQSQIGKHNPFHITETWKMADGTHQSRVNQAKEECEAKKDPSLERAWISFYDNEFPKGKHTGAPLPWDISAWGWSTITIPKEKDPEGKGSIRKHRYGVVGTYNGHSAEGTIGRILVDSSFHHWTDVNLTGIMNRNFHRSSLFVNDLLKWFGFLTPEGLSSLNQIRAFHRNVALWLAPEELQVKLATTALWTGITSEPFGEIPELFQLNQTNELETSISFRRLGQRIIHSFSKVVGEVQVRSFWVPLAKGTAVEDLPYIFDHLEIDQRLAIDEILIGGIVYELKLELEDSDIERPLDYSGIARLGLEKHGIKYLQLYAEELAEDGFRLLKILCKPRSKSQ